MKTGVIQAVFHHYHSGTFSKRKLRKAAGGWPHPVWDVDVGAGVQQVLHDLDVSLLGSDGQRRVAVLVRHVDVRVPLQQLLHNLRVTPFHCHDQGCHGVLRRQKKRGLKRADETLPLVFKRQDYSFSLTGCSICQMFNCLQLNINKLHF